MAPKSGGVQTVIEEIVESTQPAKLPGRLSESRPMGTAPLLLSDLCYIRTCEKMWPRTGIGISDSLVE